MKKALFLVLFLCIGAFVSAEEFSPKEHNVGSPILLYVYTYKNIEEVSKAYDDARLINNNMDNSTILLDNNLQEIGFAIWKHLSVGGMYCKIHVVEIVGGNNYEFSIWGHELAHCIYGAFHSEKRKA